MRKHFGFLIVAMLLATIGFAQNMLNEGFEGETFPPTYWTQQNVSGNSFARSTNYHNNGSASAFVNYNSYSNSETWLITPSLTPEEGDSIVFYYKSNFPNDASNTTFTIEVLTSNTDVSSATLLDTITNITYPFQRAAIDLSTYVGQDIFIGFHYVDNNGTGIAIDDISGVHLTSITCPMPSNLAVSNIGENTATFSWTENGEADAWTLYLKKSTDTTYTSYSCDDTIYTPTDLDASSTYNAYVVANCGVDDNSLASSTITFKTLCGSITIDEDNVFTESFESSTDLDCWTAVVTNSYEDWYDYETYTFPSIENDSYYANTGNNSLMLSSGDADNIVETMVATSQITNDISTLRVKFYTRFGSINDKIVVGYLTNITDSSTFVAVDTVSPNETYSYEQHEVMFNNAQSINNAFIAFKYITTSSYAYDLYLDDITIDLIPSCVKPSNLAVTNVEMDEATISWTENGDENAWVIYVGATDSIVVTENPYTMTDLTANTTYEIRVAAQCGSDEVSEKTNSISFTTLCDVIDIEEETPYTENFDADQILHCWTPIISYVYNSNTYPKVYNSSYLAHSGSNSLAMSVSASGSNATMIAFPEFSNDLSDLRISFYARFSSLNDRLLLGYMSDISDSSTFVTIDTIVPTVTASYFQIIKSLISLTETEGRLVFKYIPNPSNSSMYIDDIRVELIPDCAGPDAASLVVSTASSTSVTASFTDSDESHDAWTVYYKKTSETEYTTYETSDTTFTLDELDPATEYEMYVRTNCGGEVSNDSTITVTFTTTATPITEFPYEQTFENDLSEISEFMITGTGANQWAIGSATGYATDGATELHSMYISENNGDSNTYNTSSVSNSYALMQVQFGDASEYKFEFDYQVQGEGGYSSYDYLAVYMLDPSQNISVIPTTSIGSYTDSTNRLMYANMQTGWQHYSVIIPNLANTTKNIVFYWRNDVSTGYQPPAAIDNIRITASACPKPTNLTASNITEDGATLSWTETGEATQWTLYLKKTTDSVYTSQVISENPYTLTDLDAASYYQAYLVANCSDEDLSEATEVINFKTLCTELTIDEDNIFTDNFDDRTELNCWTAVKTYDNNPIIYSYYANSGTNALQLSTSYYSYYGGVGKTLVATPQFSNDINTLRVKFYARLGSSSDRIVVGYMTDLTDSTTYVTIDTIQPTATNTTYEQHIVSFASAETVSDAYITFEYVPGGSYNNSAYLDDVEISLIPNCASPNVNSLVASNITSSSVTGTFVDPDENHSSWTVYYKKTTEEEYSTQSISDTTFTIDDLDPSTTYTMYVRTNCGSEESVDSTYAVAFSTSGLPITEFPYTQNFENSENITEFSISGTGVNQWAIGSAINYNAADPTDTIGHALYISNNNGVSYAYTTSSAQSNSYARMTVEFEDASEYILSFDYKVRGENDFDDLSVYLVDDTATTLTQNNALLYRSTQTEWQHAQYTLSNVANTTKQIVFYWRNDNSGGSNPPAAIDNISIVASDCPKPTNFAASETTENSATLSWAENDEAEQWTIYVKKTTDSVYTPYTVTENPYTLTNLDIASTYQAYMVANCSDESVSLASDTISFYTTATPVTDFPYSQDFENSDNMSEFLVINGTGINQWFVGGSATANLDEDETEGHSMYISNDNGTSNAYTTNTTSYSYVTMLVDFDESTDYTFSFDYQVKGESNSSNTTHYDYLAVYMLDVNQALSVIPTSNLTSYTDSTHRLMWDNMKTGWQSYTTTLSNVANTTKKIVFFWRNDGGSGEQPPAAIDNISIVAVGDTTGGDTTIVNCNDTTVYLPQVTLCEGETYTFGTQTINASGTYTRTLTRACGDADSVISVTVVVNPTYNEQVAATINEGESYTFGSQTLTTAGTYVDTLQTVNGCDSTITLTLTVIADTTGGDTTIVNCNDTTIYLPQVTLCEGETYTFGTQTINASGTYTRTLTRACGDADSVISVTVVVNPTYNEQVAATINEGESYTFGSQTLTTAGTYVDTLQTVNGCDSVITLTLTVNSVVVTAPTVTTLSASEISDHNATLNGQVTVGSEEILEQGFEYKESTASSWQTIAANDNFTATINNLTSGTTYTFRAYVTTATDTYRGSDMTFTTTSGLLDVTDNVIISAYPNPTISDVTLKIEGLSEDAQIILTDVQGKTISEQRLPANQTTMTISTNSLSSGVYYIRVITDNMTRVEKLIKR